MDAKRATAEPKPSLEEAIWARSQRVKGAVWTGIKWVLLRNGVPVEHEIDLDGGSRDT